MMREEHIMSTHKNPVDTTADRHARARAGRDAGPENTAIRGGRGASLAHGLPPLATGLRQLITFHADGTVLRSVPGEVGIDPARPPHTAAHGVWRYLGHGRFGVTIWDIFYDVNTGQLLRYNRLRLEVTLDDDDRDKGSARAIIEVIDPQGVVVSSRSGTSSLARIPFEPLE